MSLFGNHPLHLIHVYLKQIFIKNNLANPGYLENLLAVGVGVIWNTQNIYKNPVFLPKRQNTQNTDCQLINWGDDHGCRLNISKQDTSLKHNVKKEHCIKYLYLQVVDQRPERGPEAEAWQYKVVVVGSYTLPLWIKSRK